MYGVPWQALLRPNVLYKRATGYTHSEITLHQKETITEDIPLMSGKTINLNRIDVLEQEYAYYMEYGYRDKANNLEKEFKKIVSNTLPVCLEYIESSCEIEPEKVEKIREIISAYQVVEDLDV